MWNVIGRRRPDEAFGFVSSSLKQPMTTPVFIPKVDLFLVGLFKSLHEVRFASPTN